MRATDEARAIATVRGLVAALDTRDFDAARRHLAEVVDVDVGDLWSGDPVRVNADEVLSSWRSVIGGLDAVRHDLGPVRIAVGGDRAEIVCPVDVSHYLEGRVWRVAGTYHIGLQRQAWWRVTALRLDLDREDGDRTLLRAAKRRSEAGQRP